MKLTHNQYMALLDAAGALQHFVGKPMMLSLPEYEQIANRAIAKSEWRFYRDVHAFRVRLEHNGDGVLGIVPVPA